MRSILSTGFANFTIRFNSSVICRATGIALDNNEGATSRASSAKFITDIQRVQEPTLPFGVKAPQRDPFEYLS
jgi:hypothetical protein